MRVLVTFVFMVFAMTATAQQKTSIKGSVRNEAGEPLPGVTISAAEGSDQFSTAADTTGNFLIELTMGKKYRLQFTATGYKAYSDEVNLNAAQVKPLLITLQSDDSNLDEVVVTALGIRREQKALGYAAQSLNEKSVSDARSNNWINALSGKVAGLNMTSPGSGPLNSTRITLRGDASLNADNNNALIVVDGIPMNNKGVSSGTGNAYGAGSGS
ncbi:MAG: carboxypeptidase-like regulatory domain-containing protein, partial [Flavitalea sp.]